MDKKTVFIKTNTGESEVAGKTDRLYGDAKRVLLLVNGESTVAEISKHAAPSLRESLNSYLQELADGGYIIDKHAPVNEPPKSTLKMSIPGLKMAVPKAVHAAVVAPRPAEKQRNEQQKSGAGSDLDFSFITPSSASAEANAKAAREEAERLKAEQAAQIEAAAKEAKRQAYEEAKEKANRENVAKAARLKLEEEAKEKVRDKERLEAAAKEKMEAEIRRKKEAEAAKLKAEQEALKARAELEATKARIEAEARARIEAEHKVKQEAEAARLKAEQEAEKAKRDLAAAIAKAEEEARVRIEAEARAKAEEEARKKREAEAERLRIEKERAERELARIKAEAEQRMREEAEQRVREEVAARVKAEQEELIKREAEAARLKVEKERAEQELARAKAEAEQRMREEAEQRIRAEVGARIKAEEAQSAAAHKAEVEAEATAGDPVDKLRRSFIESFGQEKEAAESSPSSFKLDTFSFDTQAPKTAEPPKPVPAQTQGQEAKREQEARNEQERQRLAAEQEAARLKAEQEEAARRIAEERAAERKAEQEAYRLQVEEEEARAKAELEAKALAEQQGKQWEEAQQRAAAQSQLEQERAAKQAAEAQVNAGKKTHRGPRKKFPLGKVVAGTFALLLLAIAGLPYVWPTADYIAPLEAEISAQIKQPVHIKSIHFALLPLPRLGLSQVEVGGGKELLIEEAVLNFDFSAWFAQTKAINTLVLNKVTLSGASMDNTLSWLSSAGSVQKYPVARMELHEVGLKSEDAKFPLLSGKADFDRQGSFTKAVLKSADDKFAVELQAQQAGYQLELNLRDGSLPIFPNIKFNDVSVNGVLENGEFVFPDFFSHIYGGSVTGKGKLSWSNGWKLDGQLSAKSLELQQLFPDFSVTGQLYGDVNVSMAGQSLAMLDKDPRMEGSFEAKDGVLNKLDIDTIARFGSRQGAVGRTSFTELNGTLKADNRGQRFFVNKIAAGSVSGSGVFEVDARQQLSGKLMVDIKGLAKPNLILQLSGTPAAPQLQAGR